MKSATMKVDILAISEVLKFVWRSIPPIISWDVKAFSLRSFRKEIMSSSTLLGSSPESNSSLTMGTENPHC